MRDPWLTGIVAACSALCAVGSAHAEVVPLARLEQRALDKHALLAAGAARTRAAAADVRQAESAYRPRMGLSADANIAPGRQLVKIPGLDGNDTYLVSAARPASDGFDSLIPQLRAGANLQVGATLYDFGKTRATIAASRAKHGSSRADEDVTRAQIVAGVRGAYLGWLSAHQLRALSTSTSADATRRSERTSALVSEGARPRGDLAPVEADRLLSELERERAEGELDSARLLLEQSVGEPLASDAEPDLTLLDLALTPELPRSPGLRQLDAQRASLEASAKLARKANTAVLSSLVSVGMHVQSRSVDHWTGFPSFLAGLSLAVPLWDGGASRAAADAADARADEVRIRLEYAELGRAQELARARLEVEHAAQRAATAEQLRAVCKARVADVEAGYELGAMQFEQVQQARALLRRAETELILARVARAEAVLRVTP